MLAFYVSYASCIMVTFNHIIYVTLVVVATFTAEVTACHNWPTKTTILKKYKHYIRSSKLIYAIL